MTNNTPTLFPTTPQPCEALGCHTPATTQAVRIDWMGVIRWTHLCPHHASAFANGEAITLDYRPDIAPFPY